MIDSRLPSGEPLQFVFEEIKWQQELSWEEAARRLEVAMYPFKKVRLGRSEGQGQALWGWGWGCGNSRWAQGSGCCAGLAAEAASLQGLVGPGEPTLCHRNLEEASPISATSSLTRAHTHTHITHMHVYIYAIHTTHIINTYYTYYTHYKHTCVYTCYTYYTHIANTCVYTDTAHTYMSYTHPLMGPWPQPVVSLRLRLAPGHLPAIRRGLHPSQGREQAGALDPAVGSPGRPVLLR